MLVTCLHCNARLQLDESKVPQNVSKARCPKCHRNVDIKSPGAVDSEAAHAALPAEMTPLPSHISPFERPPVAAQFKSAEVSVSATATGSDDAAKLLLDLLRRKEPTATKSNRKRESWDRRKVLVCTDSPHRETIAAGLAAQDYEVYIAENTAEALGRMREDEMDVLVLESSFDPVEQGFEFVTREVKLMRPTRRRRLFLVMLTANARTMDLHAAFLHNANLVVNPGDLERLPEALEVSLRHYNELYREFNRALDLTPI